MQLQLFSIKFIGPDGTSTCHEVEAVDENIAKQMAVTAAGLGDGAEVSVALFESETLSSDNKMPAWGWMVTATTPDGRVVEQQFIVALDDHDEALNAAQAKAHAGFAVALGPRVEFHHLLRRKMKRGDVFELGLQRVGRGKNKPN